MTTLPYLDSEEKLRDFTKQHWHIDIAPAQSWLARLFQKWKQS